MKYYGNLSAALFERGDYKDFICCCDKATDVYQRNLASLQWMYYINTSLQTAYEKLQKEYGDMSELKG